MNPYISQRTIINQEKKMNTYRYYKTAPASALALILAAGLLSTTARAADYGSPSQSGRTELKQPSAGMQEGTRSVQRASDLLDMQVTSRDGTTSGKVKDLVLSSDGRTIEYAAIELDRSNQMIAVPLKELSAMPDGKTLTLTSSQKDLQNRSRFTENQWPKSINAAQGLQLSKSELESRCVSNLIGKEVQNTSGEQLGSINDLLISMDKGQITTAALETGGVMGVGSKLTSVDWPSVQFQSGRNVATINQTRQQLQNSAAGEQEYWQRFGFEGEDETRRMPRSDDIDLKLQEPTRNEPMLPRSQQQPADPKKQQR
jgi:sporulation protein YlmC with PRC-barrel domain